jgi:hypothetical protein
MGGNWETLQEEHMIKASTLVSHKCLELILDPTPLPSAYLCHAQAFVHVWEYARTICALASNTLTIPFNEAMRILCFFHPLVEVDFPRFVDDFHLKT